MSATRIILADDHPVVRRGLAGLLAAEAGMEIVAEAVDGPGVLVAVQREQPDILLLDLMMPGLGGLEVLRRVRGLSPATRVIVFSMHGVEAYVLEAFRGGAMGYVLKDAAGTDLVKAIQEVRTGRRYLSPPLSERAVAALMEKESDTEAGALDILTPREREVLHLAAEGHSSHAIAERLFISPRTAETHRTNLMRKLGLHSQGDLVRYALERGLFPPTSP